MREQTSVRTGRGFAWLETMLVLASVSLVLQLLWPTAVQWWHRPMAGRQVPAHFDGATGSLHYLIYLPVDYGNTKKPWPLLLFLHGSGERGTNLSEVKQGGPPAVVERRNLPMIVVSPQCPPQSRWHAEPLLELLDEVSRRVAVDTEQIYVTGYSMGGYGAWRLAAAEPDRFAAVVPVSGGGDSTTASRLVDLPIWAFHGAQDEVIPLKASQEMIDAVEAEGGHARLTIYPEAGHGICQRVYDDDKLYEWLVAQKRETKEVVTMVQQEQVQTVAHATND